MNIKILADATLPKPSVLFPKPFSLTLYRNVDELTHALPKHDVLVCRSYLKVNASLLEGSRIQCVATASSGIDHIDTRYLKEHKITLLDGKGGNANAVADYVVATLAYLSQQKPFPGNKACVIGVGEVGSRVVMRLQAAGFDVLCYDPLNTQYPCCTLQELYNCDVICVHANWHEAAPFPSVNLIDSEFLCQLKPGTILINASRGGIVNEEALLNTSTPILYCTDVYLGEPVIQANIVDFATLCTPHIAGHSMEGKQNIIIKISQALHRHYNLPPPAQEPTEEGSGPLLSAKNNWQECILSLYDPSIETAIMKAASNKEEAFLSLRKAHQTIHDFTFYNASLLPRQIRQLLGNK